jgi:hypothetical protein
MVIPFISGYIILSVYDIIFVSLPYAWLRRTGIELVCVTKKCSFTKTH